ncbi:MAG: HAD family hydrolase [Anaerolineaceae bacterium]|nr:HAD family hydrolase [Anaerolineaceae bacterium]
MSITHLFFDLHGTLIDPHRLHLCYSTHLGHVMAGRYGLTPEVWRDANRQIMADWDSYYADLDLGGEDGIADMWEGLLRTTRALFRLTGIPEPARLELTDLSRELPGLSTQDCDALYLEAKAVIQTLHQAGWILGVASHAVQNHVQGVLAGGGVMPYFTGPLVGADTAESFRKDRGFYTAVCLHAGVPARQCLMIDDTIAALRGAQAAGCHTALIWRKDAPPPAESVDYLLVGDLSGLPALLRGNHD